MSKFNFMNKLNILLFLITLNLWSQSPIQCDRPDQTETPFTVPKNRFQIESGFSYKKDVDHHNYSIPSTLSKYGLTQKIELRLITEWNIENYRKEHLSGLQPIQLGFKINLCDEKKARPKTSLIAHVVMPKIASADFKANHLGPNFRFTMQHTLSEKLSLGYNLGAQWSADDLRRTWLYTATLGYSLSKKLGCYAEVFGFASQFESANHSFDGGFTCLISDDFMLDLSAGKRIAGVTAEYYTALGVSFRI